MTEQKLQGLTRFQGIIKFRELGLVFFIIIVSIAVQARNQEFLTLNNMGNLFTNTAILGILSVGMMMVLLTGGIDLSVGANLAFCGMVSALTVKNYPGIPRQSSCSKAP